MGKHSISHESHDFILPSTTNFDYIIVISGFKNRH